MEFLVRVEADAIVLLYCIALALSAKNQTNRHAVSTRKIYIIVILLIFLDALGTGVSLIHNTGGIVLRNIIFYLNYLFNNYGAFIWTEYIYRIVFKNRKRLPILMVLPLILSLPLILLNPFLHDLFLVTETNGYERGSLFYVNVAICYLYLLAAMLLPIINRRSLRKKNFYHLIAFTIPPIAGSLIQFAAHGLNLIWIGASFSLLLFHLDKLDNVITVDHLTGIYNRMQADAYIDSCIVKAEGDQNTFAGILLDIDYFKQINDTLGHVVGDDALKTAARLLQKAIGKDTFLARYGGDEFVIIITKANKLRLAELIEKINQCVEQYNVAEKKPYKISLSMGCAVFDSGVHQSQRQFVAEMDSLMYENKQIKKQKQADVSSTVISV